MLRSAPDRARSELNRLLRDSEDWLMGRILAYAAQRDYTRYTSTLKEAWRMSIAGLSQALLQALARHPDIPELSPDEDYSQDPCAAFGVMEAQRHRDRGVSVGMFLGLTKYYKQSYQDLVDGAGLEQVARDWCRAFVERFFDRVEIGYVSEWCAGSRDERFDALEDTNRRLTNEKNKFLTIFESLQPPVFLLDATGKIAHLNFAAARLLHGATTPGANYYNPGKERSSLAWLQTEVAGFLAKEEQESLFEKSWLAQDTERLFEVRITRMRDVSHKFAGLTVVLNDITAMRQAERERLALERQLLQSQKQDSLHVMAGSVAHHFNNLLTAVLGNLEMALEPDKDDENRNQSLREALQAAQHAAEISRAMRTYTGQVSSRTEHCDPAKILRGMGKLLAGAVPGHMRLDLSLQEPCPKIKAVPAEIQQLLLNLINNAVEATPSTGGTIRLCLSSKDEPRKDSPRVLLEVSDEGEGMGEETRQRIFDPFFSTRSPGRGLGLAIVHGIVKRHHGKIQVQSEPGQGTRIQVLLPAEAS